MKTVQNLLECIEEIAPAELALQGDPIGLQIGNKNSQVKTVMVALDPSIGLINAAIKAKANAIVLHHPLFYNECPNLVGNSSKTEFTTSAIKNNIAVMSAHTNWDAAQGGINDTLAKLLGLINSRQCDAEVTIPMSKLVVFTPPTSTELLISELSKAGCGLIGEYSECAFISNGIGTFRPSSVANPKVGKKGIFEKVEEFKLEMVVPTSKLEAAVSVIKKVHPYEEPAFDVFAVQHVSKSLSRMADLSSVQSSAQFAKHVENILKTKARLFGNPKKKLKTIGIIGGSGSDWWQTIQKSGCDALLTGEVKQHQALDATNEGFVLIEAGHFHTENPGMRELARVLNKKLTDVKFVHWEPAPGEFGRPA